MQQATGTVSNLTAYDVSPLTMIFLVDGDRILTLRRAADKNIFPNKLSGFGGKVEPGEDLVASARREFREETGLDVEELYLRGTFTRILDTRYINQLFIFVAHGFAGQLRQVDREGTAQWMTIDALVQSPDIVEHIPRYLRQVISGRDFYCGIAQYTGAEVIGYADNERHFADRRKS